MTNPDEVFGFDNNTTPSDVSCAPASTACAMVGDYSTIEIPPRMLVEVRE